MHTGGSNALLRLEKFCELRGTTEKLMDSQTRRYGGDTDKVKDDEYEETAKVLNGQFVNHFAMLRVASFNKLMCVGDCEKVELC